MIGSIYEFTGGVATSKTPAGAVGRGLEETHTASCVENSLDSVSSATEYYRKEFGI